MVDQDRSLAARAQAGDLRAFETLVERHRRRIYSLAYRMTCTHEDADDILQETFVRAYCNLRRFDPERPFANWLYTIAANLCLDRQRRLKREKRVAWDDVEGGRAEMEAAPSRTPDRVAENGELRGQIEEAIARLPERQRAALVLFEVEDLKITEVAELMECSEGAVKSTLHRARRRLRDELREYVGERSGT
jgi:RNA polymerase sigma-70 factor (ECF subfamily)